MGLKDVIRRMREGKEVYKEMEVQDRASEKLQERKLSSNERALNKIIKKQREEYIKKELDNYYKKEDNDYWHKDVISQKNIFKGTHSQLKQPNVVLKQKNIFVNNRRLF